MSTPIPIVICGNNPIIAANVRKNLLPEYEVVHVILSVEAGVKEIPLLLTGQTPPDSSSNVGSQNYSSPPAAIASGGAYSEDQVKEMRDALGDIKVPWFHPRTRPQLPTDDKDKVDLGKVIADKVKTALEANGIGPGQGNTTTEGLFLY